MRNNPKSARKFVVKNMFPGSQVEFALGDRHHYLTPHNLPLMMRIGIVFPSTVVQIAAECEGRGGGEGRGRDGALS